MNLPCKIQKTIGKPVLVFVILHWFLMQGVLLADECNPPGAYAGVTGTITCSRDTVTLLGSSDTTGVVYAWSGPNDFASLFQNTVITMPGTYTLTVTTSDGLCFSTDSVTVAINTVQPEAVATVSGVINCTNPTVTLTAVTDIPNGSFIWQNSSAVTVSTQQSFVTSSQGGYNLIVTNPVNGCASTSGIYVVRDIASPGVSNLTPDKLTCTVNDVTINVSSPTFRVKYSWTGPGGFVSQLEDPTVSLSGTYKVTVTDTINTCKSIKNILVQSDTVKPGAYISPSGSGILTCAVPSTTLSGSADITGVTYYWTGPTNILDPLVQNIVANVEGDYTLMTTGAGNGCSSTEILHVAENKIAPETFADTSGQLNCISSFVTLLGSSPASNVEYKWNGPTGFGIQYMQNPTTSITGAYILTVTDPANGCASDEATSVVQNITPPANVTAINNGPFTCAIEDVMLTGNSSTSGVNYSWTGPLSFTSFEQTLMVTDTGNYNLTVMNLANGCTVIKSTTVSRNITPPATVTAGNNGPLTCTVSAVSLNSSTSTSNVSYSWIGPSGYSSSLQNPAASLTGSYTVTVTNLANSCTTAVSTMVNKDTIAPDISAGNNGPITCVSTSVSLSGNSSTPNVFYSWNGPNNYSSNSQNPTVSVAGVYNLTVRNTVNNCTKVASTDVIQDKVIPAGVTAGNYGPLTCIATSVNLAGNSTTTGVTYKWIGPNGFNSTLQNPPAIAKGTYALQVKNPVNGCTKSTYTIVTENKALPSAVYATNNGPLTCSTDSVNLTGSSVTAGVTYDWHGPNGFSSDTAFVYAATPGTYELTVTNPVNGCAVITNTSVGEDVDLPQAVTAENDGSITCSKTSSVLTGNSTTPGVTYSWAGPNGFVSSSRTPVITEDGNYTVTVTNTANNCTASAVTSVEIDTLLPLAVSAANNGPLTCADTSVTLSGSTSTPGVVYSWIGPGSFSSSLQAPEIDLLGSYRVTITNPSNGCKDTASTVVAQDIAKPGVTPKVAGVFTCTVDSLTLSATSPVSGVTYDWTGPNGFTSAIRQPKINESGKYYVTVTNPVNGCISQDSVTTQQNVTKPDAVAAVFEVLTCDNTSVTIQASSTTPGATYSWVGPGNYTSTEQYPTTLVAGSFTVTVTNPVNGCTEKDSLVVSADTIVPANLQATTSNVITCVLVDATLNGSSSDPDVTYEWTGPDYFISTDAETAVETPGLYSLKVTNYLNGCFDTTSVFVEENTIKPLDVAATKSGDITCVDTIVALTGTSATPGVNYHWTGPGVDSLKQSIQVQGTGLYNLTVTDPSNGCFVGKIVSVGLNNAKPVGISTSVSGVLTCSFPTAMVSASSSTPNVSYSWVGPDGFTSVVQSPLVDTSGNYTVTITNTVNGCFETRTVPVAQNIALPQGVNAGVSGILTCNTTTRNLIGSTTTTGASYSWTGPEGFGSTIASPLITLPGDYTLVVTHPISGCSDSGIIVALQDVAPPSDVDATVSGTLNCDNLSVTLHAASSTGGVTYSWTGPNSFTSTSQEPMISDSGSYKLTVTNTGNGCIAKDSVLVAKNMQIPDVSAQGATITCGEQIVTITASSTTPGVTYQWSNGGLFGNPDTSELSVFIAGDYTVTVTDPINGCTNTETVNVGLDDEKPDLSVTLSSDSLTCSVTAVTLTASSSVANIIFTWTGLEGDRSVTVSSPGIYTVTAQNPANGCSEEESVTVYLDTVPPALTVSSSSTLLTCDVTSITLTAGSTTPNTSLTWTGFAVNENPINIQTPGTYYVTAQRGSNGCIRVDSVVVTQNVEVPDLTTTGGTITCSDQFIMISASSTAPVTYLWSDGGLFGDPTTPELFVFLAGDYSVTVTSTENGCTNSTTVTVGLDTDPPVCNILTPSTPPVALQNNTISAQVLSGVTYSWSVSGLGWSIVSGQSTSEFTYKAGATGTSGTISLTLLDNGNGCSGECSIVLTAVTLSSAFEIGQTDAEGDMQINVYPNPFSDEAWVEFTPEEEDTYVTIEIYSVNGIMLEKVFEGKALQSATYKVNIGGPEMANGVYYCVIKTNNNIYKRKLMLIR